MEVNWTKVAHATFNDTHQCGEFTGEFNPEN